MEGEHPEVPLFNAMGFISKYSTPNDVKYKQHALL